MIHRKIKKHILTACLLATTSLFVMAQSKELTLQDLIPGGRNYYRFIPRDLKQLQWYEDEYVYAKGDSMLSGSAKSKERVIFSLDQLNEALRAAKSETVASLPYFSIIKGKKYPIFSFTSKGHRIHYDNKENKITANYTLDNKWANWEYCEENGYLAATEGNNIRLLSPDNTTINVTNSTAENVVYGQAVHQREFGIIKGLFWSPKGSAIAFYRMDESAVTDYPILDINPRPAKAIPHKYPMAGMKSHEVTIGVYNVDEERTVWLNTGLPKEKYLTNIAWSPDEKSIYVAELNRDQNEMHLVRYSALTGEREADIFTEKDARYVEPQHPVIFLPNDPDKFIWQSERDGYNHLYLYDIKGKLLKQITKGNWVVMNVLGFDTKGDNIFISSTQPHPKSSFNYGNPLNINAWKINIKKGNVQYMGGLEGKHNVLISSSGNYLLDNYSSPSIPRKIELRETRRGELLRTLLTAPDPYKGYDMPEIVTGKIKAADGTTDLNYRLVKPLNMEPGKKYPTIVYVYGGPHAQMVTGGWMNGVGGWDIYMARRGYVLFTVDSRGSANRGHAFESVIHRNLGVNEMADQMKGIDYLKSLPFVNANKIGVFGWSYGGFMSTNLILSQPNTFKVAVAGGPVIDWSKYEIMYGERYMDRPQDNPEGYKNANLTLKAGNLKGHLLLIHGTVDPVVVWQHSLCFLKACVDANTYPDYFVYPGHEHNVIGKDRPHLHEKITRYFDDYLK